MMNFGVVQEDATLNIYYSTAAADGGEENFSATLEQADFIVHKDGSAMTLDASTITPSNVATGLQKVVVDLSNDADFTTGSDYVLMLDASDETIDLQAVSAVIATWSIESAADQATRLLREYEFGSATLGTQTGVSDNTKANLTGIVDAQAQDDLYNGMLALLRDATDGQVYRVRVTDFTNTNLLASIEALDAGVTLPTPASGDQWWFVGIDPAYGGGANLTAVGLANLDEAALQQVVDDLEDGGRLDLLIDAIKAKTDSLTFTNANEVDANVQSINNAGVVGDGNATPWDGA